MKAWGPSVACLVDGAASRLWFRGREERRSESCSLGMQPGALPLMEAARVPVIDPTAKPALLSAAEGSHKGGCTWKSLC